MKTAEINFSGNGLTITHAGATLDLPFSPHVSMLRYVLRARGVEDSGKADEELKQLFNIDADDITQDESAKAGYAKWIENRLKAFPFK